MSEERSKSLDCLFCLKAKSNDEVRILLNRALYNKYPQSQKAFYLKTLNSFISSQKKSGSISQNLQDLDLYFESKEYLCKFYKSHEHLFLLSSLLENTRYHKETPKLYMSPFRSILDKFSDQKKYLEYKKIHGILSKLKIKLDFDNPNEQNHNRFLLKNEKINENKFLNKKSKVPINLDSETIDDLFELIKNEGPIKRNILSDFSLSSIKGVKAIVNHTPTKKKIKSSISKTEKKILNEKITNLKILHNLKESNLRQVNNVNYENEKCIKYKRHYGNVSEAYAKNFNLHTKTSREASPNSKLNPKNQDKKPSKKMASFGNIEFVSNLKKAEDCSDSAQGRISHRKYFSRGETRTEYYHNNQEFLQCKNENTNLNSFDYIKMPYDLNTEEAARMNDFNNSEGKMKIKMLFEYKGNIRELRKSLKDNKEIFKKSFEKSKQVLDETAFKFKRESKPKVSRTGFSSNQKPKISNEKDNPQNVIVTEPDLVNYESFSPNNYTARFDQNLFYSPQRNKFNKNQKSSMISKLSSKSASKFIYDRKNVSDTRRAEKYQQHSKSSSMNNFKLEATVSSVRDLLEKYKVLNRL